MRTYRLLTLSLVALAFLGFARIVEAASEDVTFVVARIFPTEGNAVSGLVTFTVEGNAVRISGSIAGLSPGKHGFHVHEFGDMSSNDGSSAGGHFNPGNMKHGARESVESHAGDLGNIEADANGVATFSFLDRRLSLFGEDGIVGRALVVHKDADDLASQPAGDSGPRVGYGAIVVGSKEARISSLARC